MKNESNGLSIAPTSIHTQPTMIPAGLTMPPVSGGNDQRLENIVTLATQVSKLRRRLDRAVRHLAQELAAHEMNPDSVAPPTEVETVHVKTRKTLKGRIFDMLRDRQERESADIINTMGCSASAVYAKLSELVAERKVIRTRQAHYRRK